MSQSLQQAPLREVTTTIQINNLLGIVNTMAGALLSQRVDLENPHHEKPELDGGCQSAVEMTLIHTCNRLSDIIQDKSRWELSVTSALELQALRINQKSLEVMEEKRKAVAWLNTPSYRLKPEVIRIQDGKFAVYLGDIDKPEQSLIGIGSTPEKAFAAFDEIFAGRIPDEMLQYLVAKDDQINENKNKQQSVDDGTETSSQTTEAEGGES